MITYYPKAKDPVDGVGFTYGYKSTVYGLIPNNDGVKLTQLIVASDNIDNRLFGRFTTRRDNDNEIKNFVADGKPVVGMFLIYVDSNGEFSLVDGYGILMEDFKDVGKK